MTEHPRPAGFDSAAIALLPKLKSFAMSLCKDAVRADDLVQSTFERMMTKHHLFQEGTNLAGWAFMILRNTFFTEQRKRNWEVPDIDGVFASMIAVDEGQSSAFDLKVIRKRMRLLSPEHRKMIEMVAILGHDYEFTAETLGVAVGTVKSGVNRARQFLETGVQQVEDPPEETIPGANEGIQDNVARLFKEGKSVSEIAAALGTVKRSEVMLIISEMKLDGRRR